MSATEFCYWLQGYVELQPEGKLTGLSADQMKVISEHLQLVFKKVTQVADQSVKTEWIPATPYLGGPQVWCHNIPNIEPGTSC